MPAEAFFRDGSQKTGLRSACKKCQDSGRNQTLRKFGLSDSEYEALHAIGRCEICGAPPPAERRLSIDHDHQTGVVRGLLCNPCNMGIGLLQDSPEVLTAAAAYLHARRKGVEMYAR